MEDNQIDQKVNRARRALEQEWDGSVGLLRRYADDDREQARRDIYALYWRYGTASTQPAKRAGTVEFMVDRITGETPMLRDQLLKWVQDFRKEDFNATAREKLSLIPWTDEYAPEIIRIIGVAEEKSLEPKLRAQVTEKPLADPPPAGYEQGYTWAALLALSRMGDATSLGTVLQRVQREESIVTRSTILFEDLGYTRRQQSFDLLKTYMNSEKRLPQIKDNVPGQLEASRAAAVFSKHVRDFPIQETDFSEQQTVQAKSWVNAHTGEWQFK